jgi:gliding motility-associated-like protein
MRLPVAGDDFEDFNDTISICGPGDVSLNPDRNPDYIYNWEAHPDILDTTEANPMVSIDTSTLYSVTVTDPLNDTCIIEGTVFVFVDDRVSLPPKTIIECEPTTISLNPGGDSNFVYVWEPAGLLDDPTSPNPTATVEQSTTFSLTITDPLDPECVIKTEVEVLIEDYVPLITSDPVDMACTGDTVTLSARAELVDSIQWFDPEGNYLGGEASFEFPLEVSGVYTVLGFKGECVFMDSIFLGLRMLEFEFNKDQPVCPGEPVEIMIINGTNFQIDSIVWNPDSIISLGQGNETVVIRIDETMEINLEVYYEDGCMVEQSFTVQVSDVNDRFMAFADPDTIFFGETTTLNVTDEAGATYSWSPSNFVNDPTAPTTTAQVPETTTFTVDITDENECTAQEMVTVTVIIVNCEPPYLFMPNAFTPNGDGENDVLFVRGQYIESMDLYIYNRWGQLVFESHNPNSGWNGTYDGKELSPDVYGYHLQIECIGGGSYQEKGNVTILK